MNIFQLNTLRGGEETVTYQKPRLQVVHMVGVGSFVTVPCVGFSFEDDTWTLGDLDFEGDTQCQH